MARYECSVCGYVYDESTEGSPWNSLPDDWTCPVCSAARSQFESPGGEPPPEDQDQAEPVDEPAVNAARPRPNRALLAHRVFGYVFLTVYVLLMIQMVPRLWTYQIEFPARSVVHISLGMAIGVVLVLKISIVRFFRRLDQSLVPSLGTFLLVGSVVLIGISVPSAFREALATGRMLDEENLLRVRTLLEQTGLDEAKCIRLTTPDSLRLGQRVMRQKCVYCHDLRTVLAKPRTPDNWRQTVRRMADRTTMLNPLDEEDQLLVTAYLVALSPDLRRSTQQLREQQDRRSDSRQAAEKVTSAQAVSAAYDPVAAKQLFDRTCSQCHRTAVVEGSPPSSEDDARQLVARMVSEGLEATEEELAQIVQYLTESYANRPE